MAPRCSVLVLALAAALSVAVAYDPLDPNGNITIKWDIMSWTPDGYVAVVTINNFQMYRQIMAPGWTVGWTWAKREVIWSMVGAQATEQGDCSRFKANIPHCCKRTPTIVDLLPGVPYNQQIANCCRGGVISAYGQDPAAAVAAFQVSVGQAGTTNRTVKVPKNFTLHGPGPGYTCGPAKIVPSTVFLTPDRRRKTQALMTWNVTCTYSQHLASKYPSCCVSFSSFYNDTIVPCAKCACGCEHKTCVQYVSIAHRSPALRGRKQPVPAASPSSVLALTTCVACVCMGRGDSKRLAVTGKHEHAHAAAARGHRDKEAPLLQCTTHMCPVRVHWHVKLNYKEYWRAKIAITNFNYHMNYTQWTLVAQHPNLDNITEVFSFDYKPVVAYGSINDTAMFYGLKYFNDHLMQAGPYGNVQSEVLMRKDASTFTFRQGWAFPRKVYFNGDECQMPPPDAYPYLPNSALPAAAASSLGAAVAAVVVLLVMIVA
ncbi:COBRA-like protein 6 isoform X1 [Miscanthus floridulus]|uniref:COBRA-like protein 6 isoform X1 n=1 Tax=Miscanthus floridulus TaxID=154761 RepID=UPI003457BF50